MAAKLFGNSIPPCCDYCAHNETPELNPTCNCSKTNETGKCSAFSYDPLLRRPKVLPPIHTYTPEDFTL